jgi:hypothetical protein
LDKRQFETRRVLWLKNVSKSFQSDVSHFSISGFGVHPKKEIGIQKNKKTPFGLKVSVI